MKLEPKIEMVNLSLNLRPRIKKFKINIMEIKPKTEYLKRKFEAQKSRIE